MFFSTEEGRWTGFQISTQLRDVAVDAQFERLVPLEHQDRPGPAAGGQHGGDLPPAQGQVALEALEVRRLVPEGTVRQAEEELAVHLGEAPQPEPPEQAVGVAASLRECRPSDSRLAALAPRLLAGARKPWCRWCRCGCR